MRSTNLHLAHSAVHPLERASRYRLLRAEQTTLTRRTRSQPAGNTPLLHIVVFARTNPFSLRQEFFRRKQSGKGHYFAADHPGLNAIATGNYVTSARLVVTHSHRLGNGYPLRSHSLAPPNSSDWP